MLNRMNDCGRLLAEGDIASFEDTIGRVLPERYKAFLLLYNGGLPAPDSFPIEGMSGNPYGIIQEFLGIDCPIDSSNLAWNYEILKGRIPDDLIAIACTPSGDVICISISGERIGSVLLWDCYHEHSPPTNANVYRIAQTFDEFINGLFRSPESQR